MQDDDDNNDDDNDDDNTDDDNNDDDSKTIFPKTLIYQYLGWCKDGGRIRGSFSPGPSWDSKVKDPVQRKNFFSQLPFDFNLTRRKVYAWPKNALFFFRMGNKEGS